MTWILSTQEEDDMNIKYPGGGWHEYQVPRRRMTGILSTQEDDMNIKYPGGGWHEYQVPRRRMTGILSTQEDDMHINRVPTGNPEWNSLSFPWFIPDEEMYSAAFTRMPSYPEKHFKMGPLRMILRHFKAIQSYMYKVISNVKSLRKNIQSSMICMQLKMFKVCNRSLFYRWFMRDRQHFQ